MTGKAGREWLNEPRGRQPAPYRKGEGKTVARKVARGAGKAAKGVYIFGKWVATGKTR